MEKIHASLIIEILGKPKEYVTESLEKLLVALEAEKGVKVIKKQMHEPVPVKESKDLFTTFSEIEVEFDAMANYFGILFAYMPSHVEIISPEKLVIANSDLNDLANVLVQRLHNYDAIVKKVLMDKELMLKKLQEVAPQLFKQAPSQEKQIPPEKKLAKKKTKKKK